MRIRNQTPLSCRSVVLPDERGVPTLVVISLSRFALPPPGDAPVASLCPDAPPAPLVEAFHGDPHDSSLREADELVPHREAIDVTVCGDACAAAGRPSVAVPVRLELGAIDRRLVAIGDRTWRRRLGGWEPTAPRPFTRMPLRWERAYGGTWAEGERVAHEADNPVGRGVAIPGADLEGRPLPNLLAPDARLGSPLDRAVPVATGPIPRHWAPRARFAGTYDEAWRRRAPFPPEDFDVRFWQTAPEAQRLPTPWTGPRRARLSGFDPDGAIEVEIPRITLRAEVMHRGRLQVCEPALDAIRFDTNERHLTLVHRAAFLLPGGAMGCPGGALHLLGLEGGPWH